MMTSKIFFYVVLHSLMLVNILCHCERYWKRYYFNNTRIADYDVTMQVSGGQECVETCINSTNCNSVGLSVINNVIRCYWYPNKVYSGMETASSTIENDNMIYYIPLKPAEEIPPDYQCFYNESFCYKFYHSIKRTWEGGKTICEEDGGSLFLANSQFKLNLIHQDFVNNFGIVTSEFVYLGATDVNAEGTWNWFNGDPVNYTFFLPDRPDNHLNNQHCLCYRNHNITVSGLDDKMCSSNGNFICEITLKTE